MTVLRLAIAVAIAPLLLFHAAHAHAAVHPADSPLTVHVVDPSGAPIGGARVLLYSHTDADARRGATDARGTVVFSDVAAGEYLIDVESSGFATLDASRLEIASEASRDVSLTLAVGSFETHIIVTASKTAERLSDASKTVTVVDQREIEARGLYTVSDALRTVPGARIEQLGGPGSQTSIRLRGLRAQDTAVLLDGVPFRDLSATQGDATSFISDLLLTNVDRIEVLRGSGSDLYGSNAIAGAVNVITRAGGGPTSGEALVEGGGLGLLRAQGQLGGGFADGRVTYSIGGSGLNVANGVDRDDRAWNTSLQGRLSGRILGATMSALVQGARAFTAVNATPAGVGEPEPTGTLSARPLAPDQFALYEHGASVPGLVLGGANFIPSANDPDSARRSDSSVAQVQFADQVTNGIGYSVSYQRVFTERRFRNGPLGVAFQPTGVSRSTFHGGIDALNVTGHLQPGSRHEVTVGYRMERERYTNLSEPVNPTQRSEGDVAEWSHTASLQDRLQLLDGSLQLTGGLRAQFFSLQTPQFTPAASAPYQGLTFSAPPGAVTGDVAAAYLVSRTRTKLRAHVGHGYRAPSLFERFGTSFGSRGYSIFGDPRLAPERSVALDGGVDQEVARGHARVSLTVFTTQLDDIIVFDSSGAITRATDPFGRASGYRTVSRGRASGLELSTRTEPATWLLLQGSYTFQAQSSSEGMANSFTSFGLPRHQGSVEAISQIGSHVQAAVVFSAAGSYLTPLSNAVTFASQTYRFGGVRRLDLSATYRHRIGLQRTLRIVGRLDNLTNQTYFEGGFRTPGRVAAIGVAVDF